MRTDTALVQLRNGDWIDPAAVKLITAGRNARPYVAGNEQFLAYVRVETSQSAVMVPCRDWLGAIKFRDSLATIVNERRGPRAPRVPTETATNINGREVAYAGAVVPDEEVAKPQ